MEQSCLGCHNHPDSRSPRKDWKLGDVVGVIKIVRPLDREIESTQAGLRAFALIATLSTVLLGISITATLVTRQQRKAAAP